MLNVKQITAWSILELLECKRYMVHFKEDVTRKVRKAVECMSELGEDHV